MGLGARPIAIVALVAGACSFDTSGIGGDGDIAIDPDGASPDDANERQIDAAVLEVDADVDADLGLCEPGERALPFEATNVGRCVIEPERSLDIPETQTWRLDTSVVPPTLVVEGIGPLPDAFSEAEVELIEQPGGGELLLIAVEDLTIAEGGQLVARGDRPLALVAHGDVDIAGIASVAANHETPGAGAPADLCADHDGDGADGVEQLFEDDPGGSGGGGGAFGADGGQGARVQTEEDKHDMTAGGSPNGDGQAALAPLRGGCGGGNGWDIDDEAATARGGAAGGGLQIVAAGSIELSGIATASGGGGLPGREHSGGGGGGSGGAVLLEARSVAISGALTANGGGGGEGMRAIGGTICRPSPGSDGFIDSDLPAPGGGPQGGDECTTSGPGGEGGVVADPPKPGNPDGVDGKEGNSTEEDGVGPNPAGGGGGGGSVGRIRINACDDIDEIGDPILSPAPIQSTGLTCSD